MSALKFSSLQGDQGGDVRRPDLLGSPHSAGVLPWATGCVLYVVLVGSLPSWCVVLLSHCKYGKVSARISVHVQALLESEMSVSAFDGYRQGGGLVQSATVTLDVQLG